MGLISRVSSRTYRFLEMIRLIPKTSRCLSTSASLSHIVAGYKRYRDWGDDYEMTYDHSFIPSTMGRYKGPLSINPKTTFGEPEAWKPTTEDMYIRFFIQGTFYRLIYPYDIVIKRRLNDIEISCFFYQHKPKSGRKFGAMTHADPSNYLVRGNNMEEKPDNYRPTVVEHDEFLSEDLDSMYWLKGYAKVMLEKQLHCNITIHLHPAHRREYIYKTMNGIKNNSQNPRFMGKGVVWDT